jgi:DNA-binding PadR family transcriptional regulator
VALPTLLQLVVLRACERQARTATEVRTVVVRAVGCQTSIQTIVSATRRLAVAGWLDEDDVEVDGRTRPLYSISPDGRSVVRASLEALIAAPDTPGE